MQADTPGGWFGPETATFGDRVTGAREAAGLGRADLAERLGILIETLEAWEEDAAEPRANKLQMLAGVLGVSIPWLLTGEGLGPDGPAEGAAPRRDLRPILSEIRGLKAEIGAAGDRLDRLERRLAAAIEEMAG